MRIINNSQFNIVCPAGQFKICYFQQKVTTSVGGFLFYII